MTSRQYKTPLREVMVADMKLAGLALETQKAYTRAVAKLAAHYRRPPERLHEDQVRGFLLALIDQKVARGTFKVMHFGIKFFYTTTLGREWPLFSKKTGSACPSRSVFPRFFPTSRFVGCSPA
jgi:hypothetical protein